MKRTFRPVKNQKLKGTKRKPTRRELVVTKKSRTKDPLGDAVFDTFGLEDFPLMYETID